MRTKKLLGLLLGLAMGAALSVGVSACGFSAIGGGTSNGSVSSSAVQNSSNMQNDDSSSATDTGNENGDTTSSSLANGGEKDSSSGNLRESGSEVDSSSENSSESIGDDKKDDYSDYETDCVVYTISEDGKSASVTGYTGSPKKVKILSTYQDVPVTSIGYDAFYRCSSLTSVVIPDSVTSIGSYAFKNCSSLTSITVSENNANYKSIDGNLYSKDGTTLIQYAIGKAATEFVILDSVKLYSKITVLSIRLYSIQHIF